METATVVVKAVAAKEVEETAVVRVAAAMHCKKSQYVTGQ